MKRKLCLFYANCQGQAIAHFLQKSHDFNQNYEIRYLSNYLILGNACPLPLDELQHADLFIYQPLEAKHGIYSSSSVISHLKKGVQLISFPYIYNNALWPLFRDGKKMVGASCITNLLDQGANAFEICTQFLQLKIDFQFKMRQDLTTHILASKEAVADIKVIHYIEKNYRSKRLFLTHNHPSTPLLVHCANQILSYLSYPPLTFEREPDENEANLPGFYPMSPYDRAYYQFNYQDASAVKYPWRRVYLLRIMEICLGRHPKKNINYRIEKAIFTLFRSFSKLL